LWPISRRVMARRADVTLLPRGESTSTSLHRGISLSRVQVEQPVGFADMAETTTMTSMPRPCTDGAPRHILYPLHVLTDVPPYF
jgi:hypothetical protein